MSGRRLLALALLLSLGGCARGCGAAPAPPATPVHVTGRVIAPLGSGTRVLLVDPPAGRLDPVALQADGAFSATLSPEAVGPWVVVEVEGGGVVNSHDVDLATPEQVLSPVAVWTTAVRATRIGDVVRIDWAEIPHAQPGYPRTPRYSLLMNYKAKDGERREATFPTRDPKIEDPLKEIIDFLPELDPAEPVIDLTVRCFDPEDPQGPLWIGGGAQWNVATGECRARAVSGPGVAAERR